MQTEVLILGALAALFYRHLRTMKRNKISFLIDFRFILVETFLLLSFLMGILLTLLQWSSQSCFIPSVTYSLYRCHLARYYYFQNIDFFETYGIIQNEKASIPMIFLLTMIKYTHLVQKTERKPKEEEDHAPYHFFVLYFLALDAA